jgi:hypothetical protein
MSEESRLIKDKSMFTRAVLDRSKIQGRNIFLIEGFESVAPVIGLDLAESILRREARGVCLKQVELI